MFMSCRLGFVCSVLFLGLVSISQAHSPPEWSYDGGPSSWSDEYPDCDGDNQSPIDIASWSDARRPPIGVWRNYNVTPISLTIGNNGKTVVLTGISAPGLRPSIQNHKHREYRLVHVEFHWGKNVRSGSEHAIDGRRYPLEAYAVHRRYKHGAVVVPHEYLITSTLYKLSTSSNSRLANIVGYLRYLVQPYESFEIPPFPWSSLIPPFSSDYYTYKGSLTSPPCSETAYYFINQHVEDVSDEQLAEFRALRNWESRPMGGNFRPLQPRNGRNIFEVE